MYDNIFIYLISIEILFYLFKNFRVLELHRILNVNKT